MKIKMMNGEAQKTVHLTRIWNNNLMDEIHSIVKFSLFGHHKKCPQMELGKKLKIQFTCRRHLILLLLGKLLKPLESTSSSHYQLELKKNLKKKNKKCLRNAFILPSLTLSLAIVCASCLVWSLNVMQCKQSREEHLKAKFPFVTSIHATLLLLLHPVYSFVLLLGCNINITIEFY